MISDFLVTLVNLATNGIITQDEYTTVYNIITEAKRRQKNSVYKELAEKLNEQYKGKLVHDHVGCYHCFGYPTFKVEIDRIIMYFKPYYTYFNDSDKIESRFKKYSYTSLRDDEINTGIVIDKERTSRYVGVPGKGGHPDVDYYVTIKFNNQIFKTDDYQLYHKYNKGNKIKAKEVWYPRHKIIVL